MLIKIFLLLVCFNVEFIQARSERRISEIACSSYAKGFKKPTITSMGNSTNVGEFPFAGAVALKGENDEKAKFQCGATLISDRYALTAAHCIRNYDRSKPSFVRFGVNVFDNNVTDVNDYKVEQVTIYPEYNTSSRYHDLAIIRFNRYVQFSDKVYPICLQNNFDEPLKNLSVNSIGFANIETYDLFERDDFDIVLLKGDFTVTMSSECEKIYNDIYSKKLEHGIDKNLICAKDLTESLDLCTGSSGMPLYYYDERAKANRLIGTVSFGKACGTYLPVVFTRISKYINWIEHIVW